jgi:hypothetical protein
MVVRHEMSMRTSRLQNKLFIGSAPLSPDRREIVVLEAGRLAAERALVDPATRTRQQALLTEKTAIENGVAAAQRRLPRGRSLRSRRHQTLGDIIMTEIETAEAAVRSLEDKRQQLNERAVALADERNAIAYKAHVEGEPKARKRRGRLKFMGVHRRPPKSSLRPSQG